MAQSVRIWAKKQLRLDTLTFPQREMVEIGSAGLLSVFKRVASAQGPNDGPALPLKKKYAIWKTRKGLGNRRNLRATGQMLGSLKLRTVNDNRAYASVGANARSEKWKTIAVKKKGKLTGAMRMLTNKDVAWANQKREPWLVYSPSNAKAVLAKARQVLQARLKRMVISNTGSNLG
jgi:hypothetical protein